jgi:hypothetical protein
MPLTIKSTGEISSSLFNVDSDGDVINAGELQPTTALSATYLNVGQIGGRRNLIINGAMQVDQRNSGSAVTGISNTSNYIPDRFQIRVDGSGSGRMTAQQVTDAPANFKNSLKITVTTTDASPTASEGYAIRQSIEGQNIAHLNFGTSDAQTITISFYVKSSVTGDFSLNLGNGSSARWYGALYTVNTADIWERKTVTLTGDTTGTWASDNTSGLVVVFGLGGGSSRTTVADTWQTLSGTQTFTTGGTNLFATSSATFQITGVQLEVGSVATPFEHRSYGEELALCQRYYYKHTASFANDSFLVGSMESPPTNIYGDIKFAVPMRTDPSALETTGTASDYEVRVPGSTITCSAVPGFTRASVYSSLIYFTISSGGTTGYAAQCRAATANGYLAWSAEL